MLHSRKEGDYFIHTVAAGDLRVRVYENRNAPKKEKPSFLQRDGPPYYTVWKEDDLIVNTESTMIAMKEISNDKMRTVGEHCGADAQIKKQLIPSIKERESSVHFTM